MGSNKKKIFLVLVIILIGIIVLAGIYINIFLKKDELITNKSEKGQNIIESVSTDIENNITNEIEQNDIVEEQEEDKSNKKDTKNKTTQKETTNSKNNNTQTESKKTQNKTTNTETNKSNQSTLKKENTSSSKTSSETEKIENKNTQSNNSSQTVHETVKPIFTGTEEEKKLTDTITKYGVKINTYTTTTYNVYSDGSKTVKNTTSTTEYDRDNYSATTSELLSEAKSARSKYASMISKVVTNVNKYRNEANQSNVNGISNRDNVVLDEQLCIAACVRAVEMAYSTKFSHTRPNGTQCYTVLNEMGISYSTAGENIASGDTTADAVSNGWKNSSGHYKNMTSEKFSKIGVGVYKFDDVYYWVQLFTN